jgi:hypothetical protein
VLVVSDSPLDKLAIAGSDYSHVRVNLVGHDGNAFAVIGTVRKALRRAGASQAVLDAFTEEATAGDYDHVLATVFDWVTVTGECRCEED